MAPWTFLMIIFCMWIFLILQWEMTYAELQENFERLQNENSGLKFQVTAIYIQYIH